MKYLLLLIPQFVFAQTYTTTFSATEDPISESSNWIGGATVGLDWEDCYTASGFVLGHSVVNIQYADATALLTGVWGQNQSATGVVHSINQNDACFEEVELRLYSSITAHSNKGYEFMCKASKTASAYCGIVRWNGARGDFTILDNPSNNANFGVADGDSMRLTCYGDTLKGYINGVLRTQAIDNTIRTGSPGVGFDLGYLVGCTPATVNPDFGFTSFTATATPPYRSAVLVH